MKGGGVNTCFRFARGYVSIRNPFAKDFQSDGEQLRDAHL